MLRFILWSAESHNCRKWTPFVLFYSGNQNTDVKGTNTEVFSEGLTCSAFAHRDGFREAGARWEAHFWDNVFFPFRPSPAAYPWPLQTSISLCDLCITTLIHNLFRDSMRSV